MDDLMQVEDPIKDKMTFDKGRLIKRKGAVSHWSKASGQTFGRELGKIIDQSNRSELRNQFGSFNFRDKGNQNVIQTGNVNSPQTKALDNSTNQRTQDLSK